MEHQSFGGFQEGGRSYRITDPRTPRPLMNYLWNRRFLSAVNQFGGGTGAYGGRAAYYIDPDNRGRATLIRNGNRYFYIKDLSDLSIWNPGWYPTRHMLDAYHCDHAPGSTRIMGQWNGVTVNTEVFVPEEEVCEVWTVTVRNEADTAKRLKLYSFVEFSLEGYSRYSEYDSYVEAFYDEAHHMVYAKNGAQERPHSWYDGFIASDKKPEEYETSYRRFLGEYGDIRMPLALEQEHLSCRGTACEDMAGVLCHTIELSPKSQWEVHIFIGSCDSPKTAAEMYERLINGDPFADFGKSCQRTMERAATAQIETPEERLNCVYNYWVKQQVAMCAEVGRSTGKGFRDTLQDSMALCMFHPALAREKLVETLSHQYCDGRCPRGWLPVDSHIYSDGPVWIAPAVNAYIKETGDFSLLKQTVPYLDTGEDTVWQHVLLSVRYSSKDLGSHGLVLAHDGDWNDSLNGIGVGGKGESVWTSIALYGALGDTLEMAHRFAPDEKLEQELEGYRARIQSAVCTAGWDGDWFLAGYDDAGNPVGSRREKEGMIYLNSQTWAVLTGIAGEEQKERCLEAVDRYLECDNGVLTLYPPYRSYQPAIGRLTGFIPGIWENGAPYCHGGMFKVVTDFACGRPNQGWETFLRILPDSPKNPSANSGCEPYVFTNMYLGPENPRAGKTSFAWVTGTAGWAQRAVSEYLFGFRPGYDSFQILPSLPSAFECAKLTRRFRGVVYHITYTRGEQELIVDGKEMDWGSGIAIGAQESEHEIIVKC